MTKLGARGFISVAAVGIAVMYMLSGCSTSSSSSRDYMSEIQILCDSIFLIDPQTLSVEEFVGIINEGEALTRQAAAEDDQFRSIAAAFDGLQRSLESGDATRYQEEAMLAASECLSFVSG